MRCSTKPTAAKSGQTYCSGYRRFCAGEASRLNRSALEKVTASKDSVLLAQFYQAADKLKQFSLVGRKVPVEPGERRVLAVSVVVAQLRVT
jgi:hypothetical protein